jgi:serine/threonine protein kinase
MSMKEKPEIIDQLFHAACGLPPEERNRFLDRECGSNTAIRANVETLLQHHENVSGFLNAPDAQTVVPVLAAGTILGPYQIIEVAGTGGMGQVYRARDIRLKRDVAIKVSAERFSERFEREARAVAALNHPNICTLYDVGPNYLVMEYVEGEVPKGPLPIDGSAR